MQGSNAVVSLEFFDFQNTWTTVEDPPDYPRLQFETSDEPATLNLTASGDETTPGGGAAVEFELTNTGDAAADTPGIQLGGIWTDPGWEITSADSDDGEWFEVDGFWQIDELAPQESQSPAVTLAVPEDASPGEYVVEADAYVDIEADPVDEASATIQVADSDGGPPALPGEESPPQDPDGDGLYEDVNGDGEFTIVDVQVFFQQRDSPEIQDNPEFFNFDGDEPADVSIGDVQGLFQLFQDQG
jgi:PKD repeat protein